MRCWGKRGDGEATNRLVIVVLIVLVILLVLFFIFKTDVLEWFRNLPGSEYVDEDKTIDLTGEGDVSTTTQTPIGKLDEYNRIYYFISGEYKDTWLNIQEENNIYVSFNRDTPIGKIQNNKIIIEEKYMDYTQWPDNLKRAMGSELKASFNPVLRALNGAKIENRKIYKAE